MHKEVLKNGKKHVATVYKPAVRSYVMPNVVGQETRKGVLYYIDDAGGRHDAQAFDRTWGKRDSSKILTKKKDHPQRLFRR